MSDLISSQYEWEDEKMLIRFYTEEEIEEALSEVGVGAGDTDEVMCYLSRLTSSLVIGTDEVL